MNTDYDSVYELSADLGGKIFCAEKMRCEFVLFSARHFALMNCVYISAIVFFLVAFSSGLSFVANIDAPSVELFSVKVIFGFSVVCLFLLSVLLFARLWFVVSHDRRSAKRFVKKNPWALVYVKYYDKVKNDYGKRIEVIRNYAVAYESRCVSVKMADAELGAVYDDYRRLVYATDALGELNGKNDLRVKEVFDRSFNF